MLTLISYVAVDFWNSKTGEMIFRITKDQRGLIIKVPEAVQMDPMYGMLVEDGSIRVVDKKEAKALENDPMKGVSAEGKSGIAAELARKEAEAEEKALENEAKGQENEAEAEGETEEQKAAAEAEEQKAAEEAEEQGKEAAEEKKTAKRSRK